MKPTYWKKQPWEKRQLEFDLTDSLATGDSIASVTVTVWEGTTEKTSTMLSGTPTISSPKIYAYIQGGTDGTNYYVRVRATTTNGDLIEDELLVKVDDENA